MTFFSLVNLFSSMTSRNPQRKCVPFVFLIFTFKCWWWRPINSFLTQETGRRGSRRTGSYDRWKDKWQINFPIFHFDLSNFHFSALFTFFNSLLLSWWLSFLPLSLSSLYELQRRWRLHVRAGDCESVSIILHFKLFVFAIFSISNFLYLWADLITIFHS